MSLSEQQLVDCANNGEMGCNGGSMDLAFQYLEKYDVCTEQSYPYTAKQGKCHETNCTVGVPKGSIVGFKDVSSQDTLVPKPREVTTQVHNSSRVSRPLVLSWLQSMSTFRS